MQMPLSHGPHYGRPSLFQGASPGTGGAGFSGVLPGMPTKVVNQTLGWPTNYTINYAYVVRKFKNRSDKSLNVGQYCFLRKHRQPMGDKRLHTVVNITQLNHLLYQCALKDQTARNIYTSEDPSGILDQWTPLGVIATQVGFHEQEDWGSDQPQERLINATIRGRVSTFNLWGGDATRDGTRLYFILRRVPCSTLHGTDKRIRIDDEFEVDDAGGGGNQCHCWQFIPWGNKMRAFPRLDADEDSDHADERGVRALYIGRVSSKGYLNSSGTKAHTQAAIYDVDRLVTLPQIELFVDHGTLF